MLLASLLVPTICPPWCPPRMQRGARLAACETARCDKDWRQTIPQFSHQTKTMQANIDEPMQNEAVACFKVKPRISEFKGV